MARATDKLLLGTQIFSADEGAGRRQAAACASNAALQDAEQAIGEGRRYFMFVTSDVQVGRGAASIPLKRTPASRSIRQAVALNGLSRGDRCRASGLVASMGTLELHFGDSIRTDVFSSFAPSEFGFAHGFFRHQNQLRVPVTSFDEWNATHGVRNTGVVKIDVEGFEHEVLRGMTELLTR